MLNENTSSHVIATLPLYFFATFLIENKPNPSMRYEKTIFGKQ